MLQSRTSVTPSGWTDYVDALLRWRRFLLVGVTLVWGGIVLYTMFVPQMQECAATVSFPRTPGPRFFFGAAPEAGNEAGITVALYKRLARALADGATVAVGLRGVTDPLDAETVLSRASFSPITSGPRDDIARTTPADRIEGVSITYKDRSPERAQAIVGALGSLVSEALVTVAIIEQAESERQFVRARLAELATRRLDLEGERADLAADAAEVARLGEPAPAAEARALVDARDGGQYYLPPRVQVLGLHSQMAHATALTRQNQRLTEKNKARLAYLVRLDKALRAEFARRGCRLSLDVAKTAREALGPADQDGVEASAAKYLQAEVENGAQLLEAMRADTRFLQNPTTRSISRASIVASGMLAGLLLLLAAALLGESWRRRHSVSSAG